MVQPASERDRSATYRLRFSGSLICDVTAAAVSKPTAPKAPSPARSGCRAWPRNAAGPPIVSAVQCTHSGANFLPSTTVTAPSLTLTSRSRCVATSRIAAANCDTGGADRLDHLAPRQVQRIGAARDQPGAPSFTNEPDRRALLDPGRGTGDDGTAWVGHNRRAISGLSGQNRQQP